MIFITVGTQFPFDRLINYVSEVLEELQINETCIAQVGETQGQWKNIDTRANVTAKEFEGFIQDASFVISHAGMGTILQSVSNLKPVIVLPRLSQYGEHRNDHQVDTCAEVSKLSGVYTVSNKEELKERIGMLSSNAETEFSSIGVSDELVNSILAVVDGR